VVVVVGKMANRFNIKTFLIGLMLSIIVITLICFFYIFITSYWIIKDPQFANGNIRNDIVWDKIYCSKHECNLQYITDKAKKFVDAGWIIIIGFVGSIWTWASNYLGKISGIKQGKMEQQIEYLEEEKNNKCGLCGKEL
jgi:hypothetical protein